MYRLIDAHDHAFTVPNNQNRSIAEGHFRICPWVRHGRECRSNSAPAQTIFSEVTPLPMQQDPHSGQPSQPPQPPQSPPPPPTYPPSGYGAGTPPAPAPRGSLGQMMQRRLAVPVWAAAATGLVLLCMLCGLMSTAFSHGGNSPTTGQTGGSTTQAANTPSATNTPKATNTPVPPTATPKPKAWVTVQHFSGSQNQQTATFHVSNGMRIVWKETPTDTNANLFSIELDSASDNSPIDLIANNANSSGPESSTYAIHGDDDVYLKIECDSVNYDIQVQVFK